MEYSGKTKRRLVEQHLEAIDEDALFLDGFDDAIVGVGQQFTLPPVVIYDRKKIIDTLMLREKGRLSREEAEEHFSYNIEGAWAGEKTPLIIMRVEDMEDA